MVLKMKTLTVQLPDEVYDLAEKRAAEKGVSLGQEVVNLVVRLGEQGDEKIVGAARVRMQELFRAVKGFRVTPKIAREELYERGSLR
jgi:hypothetical protein